MYLAKYKLDGQTAFVTGGGRGIGLASAEALLEAGAAVVISDHDPAILDAGKAALQAWVSVPGMDPLWPLSLSIPGWTDYDPATVPSSCSGAGANPTAAPS